MAEMSTSPPTRSSGEHALPTPDTTMATDAAFAPAAPAGGHKRPLRNMSEVRHFFRTNDTPIYFFGATPFNLLGLDRWVRNFTYVSYYDAWDGAHPRVFTPSYKPYTEFASGEQINNWLLENAEVRAFVAGRRPHGVRPKVAMVFFDEETEQICEELGYPARQRCRRPERPQRDGDGGGLGRVDDARPGRRPWNRLGDPDRVRRFG
jgi:hypothetical protein